MPIPNFIVVGAAKSGTTTLDDCLRQHPGVYMPAGVTSPSYFHEGWPYWVNSFEAYKGLFDNHFGQAAIGEKSTSYLDDPQSSSRIKEALGPIKIIILLRNPADRAYSQWGHAYHHEGFETLDFEAAIRVEDERLANYNDIKQKHFYYPEVFLYFRQGLYAPKVQRYMDDFGRDNVLVIIFEEFMQDIANTCQQVYTFIGADPTFVPKIRNANPPRQSKFKFLSTFLQAPPSCLTNIYKSLPISLQRAIFQAVKSLYWMNQTQRQKDKLSPALRQKLLEKYMPSIHELEEVLGRDLSIWYVGSQPE